MPHLTPIQADDAVLLPHPPEEVWRVLYDVERYPAWWPRSLRVRVISSTPEVIGSQFEIRTSGGRPFCCRIVGFTDQRSIQTEYFGGFITGRGEWRIEPEGTGTRVRYILDVQASGWLVAFLAHWISLSRIHSRQMQQVFQNLERESLARSDIG